jgi:hypothetical protein
MRGFLETLLWVWFVFEKCWDFTEISNGLGCWETIDATRLVFLQYYWCGLINGRFFGSIDSCVWFVNVVDGRFLGALLWVCFWKVLGFWLGEWNPDKITLRDFIHSFFFKLILFVSEFNIGVQTEDFNPLTLAFSFTHHSSADRVVWSSNLSFYST